LIGKDKGQILLNPVNERNFFSSEARDCSESRAEERINDSPEIKQKLDIKK